MTAAQALRDIRGFAAAGRVRFSQHAYHRMDERGATERDVIKALANATRCEAANDGRWKASGPDLDGDTLTAVVALESGVLVVTMF